MTTTQDTPVLRDTAFSTNPAGGNRAGVVLDATGLGEQDMRAVAADVGYSETAFLTPAAEVPPGVAPERAFAVRYFSPRGGGRLLRPLPRRWRRRGRGDRRGGRVR